MFFSFLQNRSQEQQHYFNTPFQLSLPPSHLATEVLSDAPESADRYEFSVEHGDVILLATDGIFDNIPDSVLVKEVGSLQRGRQAPDPAEIQVKLTRFKKSVTKILENSHQNFKSGMAHSRPGSQKINPFCTLANLRIKCVTETKNVSLLFYINLKSSFST